MEGDGVAEEGGGEEEDVKVFEILVFVPFLGADDGCQPLGQTANLE